jgi:DNA invertase Pin-like site-specific DNA recombinase
VADRHRGIRIIGVSDGYDTNSGAGRKLLRGVRGLISETYLDDLRGKTHRGLIGRIKLGYHAGGLSYGYRSVVAGRGGRLHDHHRRTLSRGRSTVGSALESGRCQRQPPHGHSACNAKGENLRFPVTADCKIY